ncbi:hypothetical protein CF335_g7297 [Tilletia laevis]|nr:hypothetical protein CF335_g7297 [Tilletia laevis]
MSTQHGQPRRSFPPGQGLLFGRFQLLWPADPVPAAAAAAAEATTDRRARRFLFLLVIDGEPTELEWPGPTADDQLRRQWGLAAVFLRPVAGNLLEQALRFILEFQRGRCIYCSLRGKADDGHKYSQCPTSTMRMFRTVRPQSYARPDRNAGCYHCGMPMDFCRALVRTQSSNVPGQDAMAKTTPCFHSQDGQEGNTTVFLIIFALQKSRELFEEALKGVKQAHPALVISPPTPYSSTPPKEWMKVFERAYRLRPSGSCWPSSACSRGVFSFLGKPPSKE